MRFVSFEPLLGPPGEVDLEDIHWVIAGGESGPGARPMEAKWVRALRNQCRRQGVAFFFKQWGGRTPKAGGNTLDGRQWLEYPGVEGGWSLGAQLQVAGAPSGDVTEPPDIGPLGGGEAGMHPRKHHCSCTEKESNFMEAWKWDVGNCAINSFSK